MCNSSAREWRPAPNPYQQLLDTYGIPRSAEVKDVAAPMVSQGLLRPERQLRLRLEAKKPSVHHQVADKNRKANLNKVNMDRLYTDSTYKPSSCVHKLSLSKVPGIRSGMVATAPIGPSETLLVSEPLLYHTAAQGTDLRPKDLLEALKSKQLNEADSYRLSLLYNRNRSGSAALTSIEQLLHAEEHLKKEKAKRDAAKRGFGAATSAREETPAATMSPGQLEALVKLNADGDEYSDWGVASCRGEQPSAYIGVWPESAVLNHSCSPNAVRLLVADRMLVRATRSIAPNAEVTISHLHKEHVFAPLSERRRLLQGSYGFKCQCFRCKTEESQPPEVLAQVQAAWDLMHSDGWLAHARAVLNTNFTVDIEALQAELQQCTQRIEAVMKEAGVAEDVQPWLRASAYGAYELLAACRDGGEDLDPAQPASLTGYVSLIAPGSEQHVLLTLDALLRWERMMKAGKILKEGPELAKATEECIMAHQLRYGSDIGADVLTRLISAWAATDHHLGRYTRGSVGSPAMAASTPAGTTHVSIF